MLFKCNVLLGNFHFCIHVDVSLTPKHFCRQQSALTNHKNPSEDSFRALLVHFMTDLNCFRCRKWTFLMSWLLGFIYFNDILSQNILLSVFLSPLRWLLHQLWPENEQKQLWFEGKTPNINSKSASPLDLHLWMSFSKF